MNSEIYRDYSVVSYETIELRAMSGFDKRFRIPEKNDQAAERFVHSVCKDDLETDLDRIFKSIREHYGFKRREIQITETKDGFASIETPAFCYESYAGPVESDLTKVVWQKQLTGLRDLNEISNPAFLRLLGKRNWILKKYFEAPFDLESWVDACEDSENQTLVIDYDRKITWCTASLPGSQGEFKIRRDEWSFDPLQPMLPNEMIRIFIETYDELKHYFEGTFALS